jgi:hypothetical protein
MKLTDSGFVFIFFVTSERDWIFATSVSSRASADPQNRVRSGIKGTNPLKNPSFKNLNKLLHNYDMKNCCKELVLLK